MREEADSRKAGFSDRYQAPFLRLSTFLLQSFQLFTSKLPLFSTSQAPTFRLPTSNFPLPLILLWLLLILCVNPIGDFPLNDDWQYAYPVKQWLQTGHFEMQGQFAPNILLQVLWGYLSCIPFGHFSFSYLRLGVLLLGGCTLWVFHRELSAQAIDKKGCFVLSLAFMFSPLFFNLSFSFMTDVPFLFLCLLSIRLFFAYAETGRSVALFGASLVAIGAYAIRQPGILLLPGFAIYLLVQPRKLTSRISWMVLLIIMAIGAYIGMEKGIKPALGITAHYLPVSSLYFSSLIQAPIGVLSTWAARFLKTFIYLGVFALPVLPFLWPSMQKSGLFKAKSVLLVFSLNMLVLLVLWKVQKTFPFGGNIWFNWGLGPELLMDVYTLGLENTPRWPSFCLYLLQYLGQLSGTFISLLVFREWSGLAPLQKPLFRWLILINVLYLAVISIFSFFDRYILLSMVSFFYLLAPWVKVPDLRQNLGSLVPLLLFGLFSVFATKDYLNWNRARKEAYQWLQDAGVGIQEMDAGYEYNAWYNYHKNPVQSEGRSFWWVTDDTYLITFGPVDGYETLQRFPYYRWLWLRKDALLIVKN
ncbi:MAG: glycosyltransferase family 39 protein [Saprospiraceae bacterium]